MIKIRSINRGDGKGLILIILIIICLFFIGVSDRSSVERPKSYGLSFLSFFQKVSHDSIGMISNTFNSIGELKELKVNYEETLQLLQGYAGVERELESLRSENTLLKEQLNISSEIPYKNISARIIGKEPANYFTSFVIDKGFKDGLSKNMAVVAFDHGLFGLVGKVEEVGINSSIIIPITNSQCFVAARLQSNRYEGLVSGTNSNEDNLIMEYVSKRALSETKINELIITSGMRSLYPPGLFIGRVISISSEEYDTSMELKIKPIIDTSHIEYVFVLAEDKND